MIYGEKFLNAIEPSISYSYTMQNLIECDLNNTNILLSDISIKETNTKNNILDIILNKVRKILKKISALITKAVNFVYSKIISLMKKINEKIEDDPVNESSIINEFKIKNIDYEFSFKTPSPYNDMVINRFEEYLKRTSTHLDNIVDNYISSHNTLHIVPKECYKDINLIKNDLADLEMLFYDIDEQNKDKLFFIKKYNNTNNFSEVAEYAFESCGACNNRYKDFNKLVDSLDKNICKPLEKLSKRLSTLSSHDNYTDFIAATNELTNISTKYMTLCLRFISEMSIMTHDVIDHNCKTYLEVITKARAPYEEIKRFEQSVDDYNKGKSDFLNNRLDD